MKTQTLLKEIMTKDVQVVPPHCPAGEIAQKMRQLDVGGIPVQEGDKILGQVTDRDLVLRVLAEGRDPKTTPARDIMSSPIVWAYEDQDVEEAAHLMEENQVRRLVVLDRDKKMVGIVALGDLATKGGDDFAGEALEEISQPN